MLQNTRVTIIVAMDRRRAIGKGGNIPWKLTTDLRNFRKETLGQTVVMGRKTYESLPEKFRPLPGRENWILSRRGDYSIPNVRIFQNIDDVLFAARGREIYVAGGAEVYKLFLPHASRLVVTHVDTVVEGADTFFPPLPGRNWHGRLKTVQMSGMGDQFNFSIIEYLR